MGLYLVIAEDVESEEDEILYKGNNNSAAWEAMDNHYERTGDHPELYKYDQTHQVDDREEEPPHPERPAGSRLC